MKNVFYFRKFFSSISTPVKLASEVNVELDHPCITKLKEIIITETSSTIVLEYVRGGELFDRVIENYNKN